MAENHNEQSKKADKVKIPDPRAIPDPLPGSCKHQLLDQIPEQNLIDGGVKDWYVPVVKLCRLDCTIWNNQLVNMAPCGFADDERHCDRFKEGTPERLRR